MRKLQKAVVVAAMLGGIGALGIAPAQAIGYDGGYGGGYGKKADRKKDDDKKDDDKKDDHFDFWFTNTNANVNTPVANSCSISEGGSALTALQGGDIELFGGDEGEVSADKECGPQVGGIFGDKDKDKK